MRKQVDAEAFERYKREHGRCLGIAVCQLRAEKGLTLDQLAKRADVPHCGFRGWRQINFIRTIR